MMDRQRPNTRATKPVKDGKSAVIIEIPSDSDSDSNSHSDKGTPVPQPRGKKVGRASPPEQSPDFIRQMMAVSGRCPAAPVASSTAQQQEAHSAQDPGNVPAAAAPMASSTSGQRQAHSAQAPAPVPPRGHTQGPMQNQYGQQHTYDTAPQHGMPIYDEAMPPVPRPVVPAMQQQMRQQMRQPLVQQQLAAQQQWFRRQDASSALRYPDPRNYAHSAAQTPANTGGAYQSGPRRSGPVETPHSSTGPSPFSSPRTLVQSPSRAQQKAAKADAAKGTKRPAASCKDGIAKPGKKPDDEPDTDSDDINPPANLRGSKRQKMDFSTSRSGPPGSSKNGRGASGGSSQQDDIQQAPDLAWNVQNHAAGYAAQQFRNTAPAMEATQSAFRKGNSMRYPSNLSVGSVPGDDTIGVQTPQIGTAPIPDLSTYHKYMQKAPRQQQEVLKRRDQPRTPERPVVNPEETIGYEGPRYSGDDESTTRLGANTARPAQTDAFVPPSATRNPVRPWSKGYKKPKRCGHMSDKKSLMVTLRMPDAAKALGLLLPPKDPSKPMNGTDYFSALPFEMRRAIYRLLLVANDPIKVQMGWSQLCPRQGLDLHPAILRVNKMHYASAYGMLYSSNEFMYILRDQADMKELEDGDERTLPLRKYAANLRFLILQVEPNRIGENIGQRLSKALETLSKVGAISLTRLTIEISPRKQKAAEDEVTVSQAKWFGKSKGVNIWLLVLKPRFVYIDLHLQQTRSSAAKSVRKIVNLRVEIVEHELIFEMKKMDLLGQRKLAVQATKKKLAEAAYGILYKMDTRIEQAVLKGAAWVMQRGWFEEFEPLHEQRKSLKVGFPWEEI